jgi:hypothetical protein
MELKIRTTREFVDVSIDEINTTIFYDTGELENFINNLLQIADELSEKTERDLKDRLKDLGY